MKEGNSEAKINFLFKDKRLPGFRNEETLRECEVGAHFVVHMMHTKACQIFSACYIVRGG